MLSKTTIELCIKEMTQQYVVLLRDTLDVDKTINGWSNYKSKMLYQYEHALYELKNELQIIEEENLNE